MQFATNSSPTCIGPQRVTRSVMGQVLMALIPGTWRMWWYFGWGVLINMALATSVTAVAAEAMMLKRARGRRPAGISDLSAVVTAWLLALALPPMLPWWQTVLGSVFAIIVVKQLFGGIGYNPFNPAMAGYVLLLVSFPVDDDTLAAAGVLSGEHSLPLQRPCRQSLPACHHPAQAGTPSPARPRWIRCAASCRRIA
jgi:electron transport complex protein RnfD